MILLETAVQRMGSLCHHQGERKEKLHGPVVVPM